MFDLKKIYCQLSCRKLLLLFPVFLFPFFANAQTTTDEDSLFRIRPAEGDINVQENETDYFLRKDQNRSDTFQLRRIPDDAAGKMHQDKDFWYANAEIKKEQQQQPGVSTYTPLSQRKWFQTLMWLIIIGGFAAGIMWYLAGSNVGLFRRKDKVIAGSEEDALETEDIFAINYQKEIDKAEAQSNYRLAIRLMFLRLLKNMAGKNIIQYKQGKTNFDYLLQLHTTSYYNNFFRLTRNYEYSWYGQFGVSEEAYKIIRNDFNQFDHKLR